MFVISLHSWIVAAVPHIQQQKWMFIQLFVQLISLYAMKTNRKKAT